MKAVIAVVFVAVAVLLLAGSAKADAISCPACKLVVEFAERELTKNSTRDKVDAVINKVCTKLRVATWCAAHLVPRIPAILDFLLEKAAPEKVCQLIKLCAASKFEAIETVEAAVEPEQVKANPLSCGLCLGVISKLQNTITNNATAEAVEAALNKVCNAVRLSAWCKTNVLPKVGTILQLIISRQSPLKVCRAIRLCSGSNATRGLELQFEHQAPLEAHKHEDDHDDDHDDDDEDDFNGLDYKLGALGIDLKCSLCESVIDSVRKSIGSDKSQANIDRALDKACGKIPFAKSICKSFLKPYVQKIVTDLVNNADSHKVCANIKLCK